MNRLKKTAAWVLVCCMATTGLFSCKSGTGDKPAGNGESVELKINFKPGDKYLYSTQVSQKINSFNSKMDQTMLMEMIYAYAGEEGGNKKLDITYDHVLISMTSPLGNMTYDSRKPGEGDSTMSFMSKLIGKSFSISVAPNGDIVKVDGLADLIQSLSSAADKDTRMAVESQFSDTAIKLMMQNSFDLYPGKAVKTGESWGKKSVMGFSGINVNVENTYTLKSVANGKATVGVVSVMNLPATDMSGSAGVPMQMQMKGKQEGNMELDIATGQILSGKTSQVIDGKISAAGQDIPMNIVGDITITSKKQ